MCWELVIADNDDFVTPFFFKECSSINQCKVVARKMRKTNGKYHVKMYFQIIDPNGKRWAYTTNQSGWRLCWKLY